MTEALLIWATAAGALAIVVAWRVRTWLRERRRRQAALRTQAQAAHAARENAARVAVQRAAEAARRADAERVAEAEASAAVEAAYREGERLAAEQATRQAAEYAAAEAAERARAEAAARLEAQQRAEREAAQAAAAAEQAAASAAAAAALAATPAAPPAPQALTPGQTLVMVVDDSKVVRVKTSRLLAQHGYRVVLAEDGAQAMQLIDQELPLVLITDVEMPHVDGFELTRHVRRHARAQHMAVIMITSADDRLKAAALEAGVTLVLGKPYEESALLACIEQAMAGGLALPA